MMTNFTIGCHVFKTTDTNRPKLTYGEIEKIEGDLATITYISDSTWINRYQANLSDLTMDPNCYQCQLNQGYK